MINSLYYFCSALKNISFRDKFLDKSKKIFTPKIKYIDSSQRKSLSGKFLNQVPSEFFKESNNHYPPANQSLKKGVEKKPQILSN